MKASLYVIYLVISATLTVFGQSTMSLGSIEGKLHLDDSWDRTIYLSHIPDFGKLYTMSRSMIVSESEIDSLGYFKMNLGFLPTEDQLYRLHIAKADGAEISIVIGGKDENHIFLVANRNSKINLESTNAVFSELSVTNDPKNKILRTIDGIVNLIDSTSYSSTKIKSDFIQKAFHEQLRHIADTCSYPLVALYALHQSKFESNITENADFYEGLKHKWQSESSIYFRNFKSKIPNGRVQMNSYAIWAIALIVAFSLGFLCHQIINSPSKSNSNLKSLSIQERKIFELLKKGKTNKEISEELHVGISTVKSHVSSVYSKLKIKSRKDVLDL